MTQNNYSNTPTRIPRAALVLGGAIMHSAIPLVAGTDWDRFYGSCINRTQYFGDTNETERHRNDGIPLRWMYRPHHWHFEFSFGEEKEDNWHIGHTKIENREKDEMGTWNDVKKDWSGRSMKVPWGKGYIKDKDLTILGGGYRSFRSEKVYEKGEPLFWPWSQQKEYRVPCDVLTYLLREGQEWEEARIKEEPTTWLRGINDCRSYVRHIILASWALKNAVSNESYRENTGPKSQFYGGYLSKAQLWTYGDQASKPMIPGGLWPKRYFLGNYFAAPKAALEEQYALDHFLKWKTEDGNQKIDIAPIKQVRTDWQTYAEKQEEERLSKLSVQEKIEELGGGNPLFFQDDTESDCKTLLSLQQGEYVGDVMDQVAKSILIYGNENDEDDEDSNRSTDDTDSHNQNPTPKKYDNPKRLCTFPVLAQIAFQQHPGKILLKDINKAARKREWTSSWKSWENNYAELLLAYVKNANETFLGRANGDQELVRRFVTDLHENVLADEDLQKAIEDADKAKIFYEIFRLESDGQEQGCARWDTNRLSHGSDEWKKLWNTDRGQSKYIELLTFLWKGQGQNHWEAPKQLKHQLEHTNGGGEFIRVKDLLNRMWGFYDVEEQIETIDKRLQTKLRDMDVWVATRI